jgi:cholesterol transport system auxiliary component
MMKPALALAVMLLSACSVLPEAPRVALHDPVVHFTAASKPEPVAWSLSLARTHADGPLATPSILVRPAPDQIEVYPAAQWSEPPAALVEHALMQALEADGRIASLSRTGTGLSHDFELDSELRAFQMETHAAPTAVLRIKFSLIGVRDGRVLASRVFEHEQAADGRELEAAVAALAAGLEALMPQVVAWTVEQGEIAYGAGKPSEPGPEA